MEENEEEDQEMEAEEEEEELERPAGRSVRPFLVPILASRLLLHCASEAAASLLPGGGCCAGRFTARGGDPRPL